MCKCNYNDGPCTGHCKSQECKCEIEKPEKPYSAEEVAEFNKLLGPIDTDEGIEGGVEDISNEDLEKVSSLLFPNEE